MKLEILEGSSTITAFGYDEANKVLAVKFSGADVYVYHGVIKRIFDGFVASESKGSFLSQNIKPFYSFTKLDMGS